MKQRGKQAKILPDEEARIKELFNKTGNQQEVARRLGRSKYAIFCVIKGRPVKKKVEPEFFRWEDYEFSNVIV